VAERLRLVRTKGSVRREGVVVCDRSTVFGNPWRITDAPRQLPVVERPLWVVRQFAADLVTRRGVGGEWDDDFVPLEEIRVRLSGRDLGCWCALDAWCHAGHVLMPVAAGVDPVLVFRALPQPPSVAALAARLDAWETRAAGG
jgi:hypothetical protein